MKNSHYLVSLVEHKEFVEGEYWWRQQFGSGDVVVREGARCRKIYYIESGEVSISARLEMEESSLKPGISTLSAGEVFGEPALFEEMPRSATVTALSDCTLLVFDAEGLLQFLDQHQALGYDVMKEMLYSQILRLRKNNERLFSLLAWGLKAHGIDKHL